jgi:putative endonuclease
VSEGQGLGKEAEDRAAEYLLSLGYIVVTRNFRVRGGEIDLICLDGDTIVFVEVKARQSSHYRPEEAIGRHKVLALQRTAQSYLRLMEERRSYRFDVVAIEKGDLRHHKHIFGH